MFDDMLFQKRPELHQIGAVKMSLVAGQLNHLHRPFGHIRVQLKFVELQVKRFDCQQKQTFRTDRNDVSMDSLLAEISNGFPSKGQHLNCQVGSCMETATTRCLKNRTSFNARMLRKYHQPFITCKIHVINICRFCRLVFVNFGLTYISIIGLTDH